MNVQKCDTPVCAASLARSYLVDFTVEFSTQTIAMAVVRLSILTSPASLHKGSIDEAVTLRGRRRSACNLEAHYDEPEIYQSSARDIR